MNFQQSVASGFQNYFNFKDRSCRSEYWFFRLFSPLSVIAVYLADLIISTTLGIPPFILTIIWALFLFIPLVSLSVRRLHDTNKSGLWIVFAVFGWIFPITQIIFVIYLIISKKSIRDLDGTGKLILLALIPGFFIFWNLLFLIFSILPTQGPNQFGEGPLKPKENT